MISKRSIVATSCSSVRSPMDRVASQTISVHSTTLAIKKNRSAKEEKEVSVSMIPTVSPISSVNKIQTRIHILTEEESVSRRNQTDRCICLNISNLYNSFSSIIVSFQILFEFSSDCFLLLPEVQLVLLVALYFIFKTDFLQFN